jgi:hypothetical protein
MYRPQFIDTDWPQSITRLQGKKPTNPKFYFCCFMAVIDLIANTTVYKIVKFFLY